MYAIPCPTFAAHPLTWTSYLNSKVVQRVAAVLQHSGVTRASALKLLGEFAVRESRDNAGMDSVAPDLSELTAQSSSDDMSGPPLQEGVAIWNDEDPSNGSLNWPFGDGVVCPLVLREGTGRFLQESLLACHPWSLRLETPVLDKFAGTIRILISGEVSEASRLKEGPTWRSQEKHETTTDMVFAREYPHFPDAVALNAVRRKNMQMSANERKRVHWARRVQKSASA